MTNAELTAAAHECAGFAIDNYPRESPWDHSPSAMWESWHAKEETENPGPMPRQFRDSYLSKCLERGGWEFVLDCVFSLADADLAACDLCGKQTSNTTSQCCGSRTCDACIHAGCFCSSVAKAGSHSRG